MPPKEDGTPPKSFTFITGNPRSKKNITQIRRHAGQNSGHKATSQWPTSTAVTSASDDSPPTSYTWSPRQYVPSSLPSAGEAHRLSTSPPPTNEQRHSWPPQGPVSSRPTSRDEVHGSAVGLQRTDLSSPVPSYQRHVEPCSPNSTNIPPTGNRPNALDVPSRSSHDREGYYLSRHMMYKSSKIPSSSIIEPSSPPFTNVSTSAHRRNLTIQELVNTSEPQGSRFSGEQDLETKPPSVQSPQYDGSSLPSPSGMQRPYDFRLSYPVQKVTRVRTHLVQRKHGNHAMGKAKHLKRRPLFIHSDPSSGSNKDSPAPSRSPRNRHTWRIEKSSSANTTSPIAPTLALSKDDFSIAQTLSLAASFFTSQMSTSFLEIPSPVDQVRHRTNIFLAEGSPIHSVETFSGAITTAAGLLAVDRIDSASSLLNQALPNLHDLLTSQHPQLYPVLAELSLDCHEDNSLARLRGQIKQFAASLSHSVLGGLHPITRLLRLELSSPEQTARLRELVQRKIHDLHVDSFSLTDPLTITQRYYLARVLAQLGHLDDAVGVLDDVSKAWEQIYGPGSLMCILGMIERAKVRMRRESVNFTEVEHILQDALARTMDLLGEHHEEMPRLPASTTTPHTQAAFGSTYPQNLPASIVHARMACLRTLGRLYAMQDLPHRALQYYSQSAMIGIDELGLIVPAVQLILADLDVVGKLAVLDHSQP
ncbi:uncharacterized protein A1O9_11113 [Exophiala aquamarina CBS 119918]|uniref:Uncharacterized protein n=1 Tax=Exophiala aquamarina CBS 119918 TaxID=1182545 RepID=A0A072NYP7_9EURO|nr:uncharacterized protein A1O9_11113 [Exophiala aquamarina CBS 119918]KEF52696.1 hypothetical protein A1O9_11113 [Exophiala aquamarina CBS 119918]